MITEYVYNGHDNLIDLLLKSDDVAVDLSSMTKINLKVGSKTITNSTGTAWPIKWLNLGVTGKVSMKLGDQSITVGKYIAELEVFDVNNPNGIHWGNFRLIVE